MRRKHSLTRSEEGWASCLWRLHSISLMWIRTWILYSRSRSFYRTGFEFFETGAQVHNPGYFPSMYYKRLTFILLSYHHEKSRGRNYTAFVDVKIRSTYVFLSLKSSGNSYEKGSYLRSLKIHLFHAVLLMNGCITGKAPGGPRHSELSLIGRHSIHKSHAILSFPN